MEKQNSQQQKNGNKKKTYNLLIGFVFIAVGGYRLMGIISQKPATIA